MMPPTTLTVNPHPKTSQTAEKATTHLPRPTTPPTPTPTSPSPLLALPAPLRNRIYALVVLKRFPGNPISINQDPAPYFSETAHEHLQPALSLTSRQLRAEVLPIYYGRNLFGVRIIRRRRCKKSPPSHHLDQDRARFVRWLDVVGEANAGCIARFRFDVEVCAATLQLQLQSGEPGFELRKVTALSGDGEREREVRGKVEGLLGEVDGWREGERMGLRVFRGVEERLFRWSQSDRRGKRGKGKV